MAMCFVPNVYYVCLACAARSILVYCKCCKEKNTTTISRGCTQRGPHVISLYSSTIISNRSAFCQFPFRWIYYCLSSKSTGKETGKMHLCAATQRIILKIVRFYVAPPGGFFSFNKNDVRCQLCNFAY